MDITRPTHHFVESVSFHLLSPDEIIKSSVKEINATEIFDGLNHPVPGGLYDPSLGPIDKTASCQTCSLGFFQCPGHFGHVELAVPVYAPLVFAQMYQLLRQTCLHCHKMRSGSLKTALLSLKIRLLDRSLLNESKEIDLRFEQLVEAGSSPAEALTALSAEVNNKIIATTTINNKRPINRKNGSIHSERNRIINDYLKKAPASMQCQSCRLHIPTLYRHGGNKIFISSSTRFTKPPELTDDGDLKDASIGASGASIGGTSAESTTTSKSSGLQYLTPMHVFEHLKLLWENEDQLLGQFFGSQFKGPGATVVDVKASSTTSSSSTVDHRIFFQQVLSVPPSRFRPPSVFGGSQFDHPQNTYLLEIIKLNKKIVEIGDSSLDLLVKTWIALQDQCNWLFDSSKCTSGQMGKTPPPGLKQILEKKEGLFRKHMMGKRVNYAARSVISPDPFIATNEIGIPMHFATRLTYPEPVCAFNVERLKDAVCRGSHQHPGATHIQRPDGSLISLEGMSEQQRRSLSCHISADAGFSGVGDSGLSSTTGTATATNTVGQTVVHRHIRNNDIVLMNRQPTLHKPSMMAHKVRVLEGEKTLRMHYANCNTYNADFDGDEMNLHFPQSELARAECYLIANCDNQYLVPTDGSPLRGLIQDHIVSGVLLTLKDTLLTKDLITDLLWAALSETLVAREKIILPPPAMIKPFYRWTGKQVISIVLEHLRPLQSPPITLTSKAKLPARLWGKANAEESVITFQSDYLVHGCMDKSQFGASAFGITHAVFESWGPASAGKLLTSIGRLMTRYDQHFGFTCRLDDLLLKDSGNCQRSALIQTSVAAGPKTFSTYIGVDDDDSRSQDERNDQDTVAMEKIVRSDELARGLDGRMKQAMNDVTSSIIDVCLPKGQLRPFPFNNMSLMTMSGAKGSMVNSSQISGLLGQQELEGRRVPVMVSGKTLPSFPAFSRQARHGGYVTQRFLTGLRPQEFFFHCMAGREGLIDTAVKTSRSGYLQRCLIKHMESLKVQYDGTVRDSDGTVVQFLYGEDGLDVIKQKYLGKFDFLEHNLSGACNNAGTMPTTKPSTTKVMEENLRVINDKDIPISTTTHPPHLCKGSTSETFLTSLLQHSSDPAFVDEMLTKYQSCLVEPGEAVGLLAAQGVGEPSTQMTLNTFHFAGFGAKNVTLGIPRLREIIMTATQKIKTPSITVPLLGAAGDSKPTAAQVEKICRSMNRLTLRSLLKGVEVGEELRSDGDGGVRRRYRMYTVKIRMLGEQEMITNHHTSLKEVAVVAEGKFIRRLLSTIDKKATSSRSKTVSLIEENMPAPSISASAGAGSSSSSDSSSDDEDISAGGEFVTKKQSKRVSIGGLDGGLDDLDDGLDGENNAENSNKTNTTHNNNNNNSHTNNSQTNNSQNFNVIGWTAEKDEVSYEFVLKYPAHLKKIPMLEVVEDQMENVLLREIKGITSCFPNRDSSLPVDHPPTGITTEGGNIRGLWEYGSLFDLNNIFSNDIYSILTIYGVEAARATIVREVGAVFAVYGISVDHRHLYLIADYMTFDGGYRPFNRMGIAHSPSPLLQMTFETTVGFLRNACLSGDYDDLKSPSSQIVMGQPVSLGTNSFDVRHAL